MEHPTVISSDFTQSVLVEGHRFDIEIYRLEDENHWTLEIVNASKTSFVWDEKFSSEKAALAEAISSLEDNGINEFLG